MQRQLSGAKNIVIDQILIEGSKDHFGLLEFSIYFFIKVECKLLRSIFNILGFNHILPDVDLQVNILA